MEISIYCFHFVLGKSGQGDGELYLFLKNFGFKGEKKLAGNVGLTMMCYIPQCTLLKQKLCSYFWDLGMCRGQIFLQQVI